ncbi:MAG TPA: choice-of-anchor D domain-containing protein [Kofleriaceae bacterium]|nr:choice-of-anchor D domain-containing protein [Kofleriaceae bacterium]
MVCGLAWSRAAHAAVTPNPSNNNLNNVVVKASAVASTDLNNGGPGNVVVGSIVKDATCTNTAFSVTGFLDDAGSATTLPATVNNGQKLTVQVTFSPTVRLGQSCLFNVFDNGGTPTKLTSFTVSGTGIGSVATLTPTSLAYGSVRTTSAGSTKSFTITNTGDAGQDLTVNSISVSAGGADYTLVSPPTTPFTIAVGDPAVTVNVKFLPSGTGSKPGTVTVMTDSPVSPANPTVSMTGTGTTAIISVPATMTIPNVVAGSTGTNTVAVSNTGSGAALTVSAAALTSTGGSWITFANTPAGTPACTGNKACTFTTPMSIVPGTPQNVTIRCAPPLMATGSQMETLTFTSDTDPSLNSSTTVSCTAVKPDIGISPISLAHDFGNVHVGNTATFNSLVISNTGTSPLTYTIARQAGATAADFTVSGAGCNIGGTSCTTSLAAGSTSTYTATFKPTGSGNRAADLLITSDDQDAADASQTFHLTGVGTQPTLVGTPINGATLAFGSITVATSSNMMSITAMNGGNEDMTISSAALGGANPGEFQVASGSLTAQTVTMGNSAMWQIVCHPNSRGGKTASFTVNNNSTNTPTYTVILTCTGVGPNLVASPSSIDFGNVREGTTQSKTFTLSNNGEQTATISATTLAPSNVGYTFSGIAVGDTITSGNSKTVTITFSPVAGMDGGPATLTMASNAVNTPAIVTISGVGQPFGVSVTCPDCAGNPVTMDYGQVRWDTTKSEVFTISNTADADVTIQSVAIGNQSFGSNFTIANPPSGSFVLSKGGSRTFTVNADPNDTMLGAFTAQLQVLTDLPPPMMMVTRNLAVDSTSPALTVQPGMTVDFGGVDIDKAIAKTLTITVQNTGDGPMDITSWPALGGGPFTAAGVTPKTIAVGGMQTLDVSYLPTVEKTAQAGDTVDVLITIDGLFSTGNPQPTIQKVTLKGHGIDRHIQLLNSPVTFPATFDNPTDTESPALSCDVMNTGEAPLVIDALMLDNSSSPAFMLLDTQAQTVDGGQTAKFRVSFKPGSPGTNYTATLVLMHDDEDSPTPHVSNCALSGSAGGRMVDFMPNTEIDLGITGVGVPVKLTDKNAPIQLVNHDGSHTFDISKLELSGDMDQFTLIDTSNSKQISANQTLTYDVEFDPDHAGDFSVTMTVFLDNSPRMQGQITIKGKAVDLEVRGGGCDASGGGGWGAIVLALGVALWMSRRRALATAILIVGVVGSRAPARAGSQDVDLANFTPAPTTEVDGFQVESAKVGDDGAWALGVVIDTATNPLHVQSPQVPMEDHPITSRTAFDLGFAYAFGGRFEAGVLLPLLQQSGEAYTFSGLNPPDGMALGDAMIHGKAQLLGTDAFSLAASATITAPTHSADQYAGAGAGGRVSAIAAVHAGRIGVNANLGVLVHGTQSLGTFEQGDAATFGAGASFRALTSLSVVGELFGQFGVTGSSTAGAQPLEGVLGFRYRLGGGIDVGAGFGRGLMHGIGAPDYRGFLAITYAPKSREPEPLPGDRPPPPRVIDRGDSDGDGIINSEDQCPTDAEDKDGFKDDDGCPDPDNDGDGIPDNVDKCAGDAEDKDGFQDEDGCPDLDNDGDGVPDAQDKCPMEPEDKDGFQDNDGCDDPDNDHDGIPDIVDQCATEPETINGQKDEDGCPDSGDSAVMVQADRIEIFEPISFVGQTATIDKKSANVLGQVAATLAANPEFKRIRVTVHVQPRGGGDEDLTEKRAEAVRQWLIKRGIEPERLESKGMGSTRPLVPKGQKGAAAINDRVEFIIMEKK